MQYRHFLVEEKEGDYKLREIDAVIANGISLFGIITGQCHTVESQAWKFYFMNSHLSEQHADTLAQELSEQYLKENRGRDHSDRTY